MNMENLCFESFKWNQWFQRSLYGIFRDSSKWCGYGFHSQNIHALGNVSPLSRQPLIGPLVKELWNQYNISTTNSIHPSFLYLQSLINWFMDLTVALNAFENRDKISIMMENLIKHWNYINLENEALKGINSRLKEEKLSLSRSFRSGNHLASLYEFHWEATRGYSEESILRQEESCEKMGNISNTPTNMTIERHSSPIKTKGEQEVTEEIFWKLVCQRQTLNQSLAATTTHARAANHVSPFDSTNQPWSWNRWGYCCKTCQVRDTTYQIRDGIVEVLIKSYLLWQTVLLKMGHP